MKRVTARRWTTNILFGASGAGKTSLAATAPRPIFMDSNQGMLSIADRPGLEHVKSEDIFKMNDLDRAYRNCKGTGKQDWRKKFDTIVIDHFDDVQALVLDELGEGRAGRDDRFDPDDIDRKTYGIMGNRLRRYIRKFKAVPMHKILICSEMEDRNSGGVRPGLVGALREQLPFFADNVIYLRVGKGGARYLQLHPKADRWLAKTRAWWLTEQEAKIKFAFDDLTCLTTLFELIAAGPKRVTSTAAEES